MKPKSSLRQGTLNSYSVSINDLLNDSNLSFLIDKNVKKEFYYNDYITETQVQDAIKEYSVNSKETIVPINEMTAKEIRAGADAARLMRSRDPRITCKFLGVTGARGWLKFQVTSQYTPGKKYLVHIKLKEANDMKYFKEFKKQDIIRLFLSGDLQLNCQCADFRYRMRYQAWQMGYGLFKELRFPHIANPKLTGTVCKHCLATLRVMNANWMQISKSMQKSTFFKRKYEDDEYMNDLERRKASMSNRGRRMK